MVPRWRQWHEAKDSTAVKVCKRSCGRTLQKVSGRKVQGAGKVDAVEPETFLFCSAAGSFSLDFGERMGMLWKGIGVARS